MLNMPNEDGLEITGTSITSRATAPDGTQHILKIIYCDHDETREADFKFEDGDKIGG